MSCEHMRGLVTVLLLPLVAIFCDSPYHIHTIFLKGMAGAVCVGLHYLSLFFFFLSLYPLSLSFLLSFVFLFLPFVAKGEEPISTRNASPEFLGFFLSFCATNFGFCLQQRKAVLSFLWCFSSFKWQCSTVFFFLLI